jgi:hypothetical protein
MTKIKKEIIEEIMEEKLIDAEVRAMLDDSNKHLRSIRSKTLEQLLRLYRYANGLMQFWMVEFNVTKEEILKRKTHLKVKDIQKHLKCSTRTAYDYYHALMFLSICDEIMETVFAKSLKNITTAQA